MRRILTVRCKARDLPVRVAEVTLPEPTDVEAEGIAITPAGLRVLDAFHRAEILELAAILPFALQAERSIN